MTPLPARLRPRNRTRVVVALLLLLVAAVAVGPGLLPGRTPLPLDVLGLYEPWRGEWPPPANPLLGDPVLQFAPRVFIAESYRAGHLPLWNPALMSGHPTAGDSLTAPFAPLHVLPGLVLLPLTAYAMQLLLQLWLAGLLAYGWLRALRSPPFAALVGALVWMLAGYQQVWLTFPFFLGTLMWLPAVTWAWEHAAAGGGRRAIALGGLAAGLVVLGGHLQLAAYGALLLAAYVAGRLWMLDPDARRRGLASAALMAGLGLGVGAVALWPALAQAAETVRSGFGPTVMDQTAVPLRHLVTALLPWSRGDPRAGTFAGPQNYNELALYVGWLPLVLALAAPIVRRDRLGGLAGGLMAVVAVMALGAPGVATVVGRLPYLRLLGLMRWLALWPLAVALAVGLAVASAMDNDDPSAAGRLRRVALALTAGLALVAVGAAGRLALEPAQPLRPLVLAGATAAALAWWTGGTGERRRQVMLAGVLVLDLLAFGHGYAPAGRTEQAYPPLASLDVIVDRASRGEPVRVMPVHRDQITLGPGVAPMLGLHTVGGYSSAGRTSYHAFVDALSEPAGNRFVAANPHMVARGRPSDRLLALLNVRHVLSDQPLRSPLVELRAPPGPGCRTATVAPGERLATRLTPEREGLNRIDVRAPSGGPLSLAIAPADAPDAELVRTTLAATDEPGRTAYFAPLTEVVGRELLVYVKPEGDQPAAVCASAGASDALAIGAWAVEQVLPEVASGNGLWVHRSPAPLGAAWLVGRAVAVERQRAALERVAGPDFDPRTTVVIERHDGESATGLAGGSGRDGARNEADGTPAPGTVGQVRSVTRDGPNGQRIALETREGGWLVVSEAYAPGWQATVDGQPAPVVRADGGLQAVPVPAGAQTVVLDYRPRSVRYGAVLTLLALAVGLGVVVRGDN